jgi:hypothetical protein
MFASNNGCRGKNKSRRDDIQSVMLLLVYLLNGNKLPWSELDIPDFSQLLRERLK